MAWHHHTSGKKRPWSKLQREIYSETTRELSTPVVINSGLNQGKQRRQIS